jgi:hypothetical protein
VKRAEGIREGIRNHKNLDTLFLNAGIRTKFSMFFLNFPNCGSFSQTGYSHLAGRPLSVIMSAVPGHPFVSTTS